MALITKSRFLFKKNPCKFLGLRTSRLEAYFVSDQNLLFFLASVLGWKWGEGNWRSDTGVPWGHPLFPFLLIPDRAPMGPSWGKRIESFPSILGSVHRFSSTFLNAMKVPPTWAHAFRFWGCRQFLVPCIQGSPILKGHTPFILASFHFFSVLIDFFGHIRKHSR